MNFEGKIHESGTFFHDDDIWTPFKKFQEPDEKPQENLKVCRKPIQRQESTKVLGTAFKHSGICVCAECNNVRHKDISKCTEDIFTRVAPLNMCYIDNGTTTVDVEQLSLQGIHLLRGELVWSSLLASSFVRKHVKWRGSFERENFLNCLHLRAKPAPTRSSSLNLYEFERFSDESGDDCSSEGSEVCGLNFHSNSFCGGVHVTEDGLVFNSQEELEEFKAKMDGMANELKSELEMIKDQHQRLKAEKEDDKNPEIVNRQVNGSAVKDNGNNNRTSSGDKAVKDRPKSAILVTLQGAFSSIAKVGNIGSLFNRNGVVDKAVAEDDDDDNETFGPVIPEDFHDEWTRKMESEGGLRYQSSDNTTKQLSYNSLPPPLKLDTYIAEKRQSPTSGSPTNS